MDGSNGTGWAIVTAGTHRGAVPLNYLQVDGEAPPGPAAEDGFEQVTHHDIEGGDENAGGAAGGGAGAGGGGDDGEDIEEGASSC